MHVIIRCTGEALLKVPFMLCLGMLPESRELALAPEPNVCRPRPPAGCQWGPVGAEKCGRCSDRWAEFKQMALTSKLEYIPGEEKLKQLMCGGPIWVSS